MSDKILIASDSRDKVCFGKVASILEEHGYDVTVFEPDSIVKGSRFFSASLRQDGKLDLRYDDQALVPEDFRAAWYRRPELFDPYVDRLRFLSLKEEYRAMHETIWANVAEHAWLNAPQRMRPANNKLRQLEVAASIGFKIPDTLVTNSWKTVEAFEHEKLIVKMATNVILASGDGEKVMPTTVVPKNNLPKAAAPYPGIWQPYLEKKREWRITVVGDKVFSVAIYTDEDAKDDWRMHQLTPKVTFKAEPFPKDLQKKCHALLDHYGLRYGAFDFVETPGGQIVFLEVNVNGQFAWLEAELGLPISEAIADELMSIAKTNKK